MLIQYKGTSTFYCEQVQLETGFNFIESHTNEMQKNPVFQSFLKDGLIVIYEHRLKKEEIKNVLSQITTTPILRQIAKWDDRPVMKQAIEQRLKELYANKR